MGICHKSGQRQRHRFNLPSGCLRVCLEATTDPLGGTESSLVACFRGWMEWMTHRLEPHIAKRLPSVYNVSPRRHVFADRLSYLALSLFVEARSQSVFEGKRARAFTIALVIAGTAGVECRCCTAPCIVEHTKSVVVWKEGRRNIGTRIDARGAVEELRVARREKGYENYCS